MARIFSPQSKRTAVYPMTEYSGVSSRKVRREKKKVMSQSMLMLFGSIAILLTFIFVIIPNFIALVTNFLDSSSPFQEVDDTPPQIPIVSAPVSATNSAELKVSGFGEPDSSVIFVLNGAKGNKTTIKEDGSFEVSVTLQEGENKLSAYSIDTAENESAVTKEYTTFFDTKPPALEEISPEDGSSFETRAKESVTISGKTDEDDTGVKIYIAGKLVFPKSDGSFSHTIRLNEGENKIEILAQDKAGNSNKLEVIYTFSL